MTNNTAAPQQVAVDYTDVRRHPRLAGGLRQFFANQDRLAPLLRRLDRPQGTHHGRRSRGKG